MKGLPSGPFTMPVIDAPNAAARVVASAGLRHRRRFRCRLGFQDALNCGYIDESQTTIEGRNDFIIRELSP